ncbi:MAG: DNA polymerase III subunit epsilon [Azoarcus sp.]|uniref:DNA polymerase-3 subunit epsilon n=1 Tax=Aromatoleum tolulyticum TaxID=34027 RepID=A0A1N6R005_9RHOO|nr:3'-5' exonuclease [Aromatoleum tolulyticum]MCK9987371.1 DNA polymerase III subunit epsilon [Azoarcus sp.]SIQ22200.1 DNA polymerase-3 subunit epsilon [Aromatoleum tolulyticum]
MNWLTRLLGTRTDTTSLDAPLRDAIASWEALAAPELGSAHFETRYVVINTEATGLDLDKDRLLAVAAIAIDREHLSPHDSYYAPLEPDAATALTNLLTFAGKGPVVVFNASFNRSLLERALDEHLGLTPDWTWLDLHWLLPALYDEHIDGPARLADWMKAFGIETFQRHHALGGAWAIAQLMLAAQARARALGLNTPRSLADLEHSRRQLRRHG